MTVATNLSIGGVWRTINYARPTSRGLYSLARASTSRCLRSIAVDFNYRRSRRQGSITQARGRLCGATDALQTHAIFFHGLVLVKPVSHLFKEALRCCVRRIGNTIMHPFAFAPCFHNSRAPQIRKMPRDLGLIRPEDFHEKTHADFSITDQVQKPEPRPICQRAEEKCQVQFGFVHGHEV